MILPDAIVNSSVNFVQPVLRSAVFALAIGSSAAEPPKKLPAPICFYKSSTSQEAASPIPKADHGSVGTVISHEQVADSLMATLAKHGLVADRKQKTDDDSLLYEFFNTHRAVVDIYPTGEIVVIVKSNGLSNVFELGVQDINRIVELVRDGYQE